METEFCGTMKAAICAPAVADARRAASASYDPKIRFGSTTLSGSDRVVAALVLAVLR